MKKTYLIFLFICIFTFSFNSNAGAQVTDDQNPINLSHSIEGFMVSPNPVPGTSNKLYITSKENKSKIISIYNVLGERVMYEVLIGKELNISKLTPGLYVLKCVEGNSSATIKLVKGQ